MDYHVSCDTWFMTLPKRFSVYDNFIYYDINDPLGNDVKKLEPNSFDFILADPPFWLEEVLLKLFQTINHLKTHNGKTMICAGPPMTSFLVSSSGLLRTSTSSPSWIFEALVPVPKVVADVLVFVHSTSWLMNKLLGYKSGISGRKQGIWQSRNRERNRERRRPAEA